MTKKTLSFPVPKKPARPLTPLALTQFALEQVTKRTAALEKQCDGLAKLDKEKDFAINLLTIRVKRLEDRITRRDSE